MWEPRLIAPFQNSGLKKYFKPWIIGNEAFPDIQDAYAWRGSVRKREGFRLFAVLPSGDAPVQGLKFWVNPSSLSKTSVAFSQTKSYFYNTATPAYQNITFLANPAGTAFSFTNGPNDYFWTSNYAGSMWEANGLITDQATNTYGIMFWNGTPGAAASSGGWSIVQPVVNGTPTFLNGALIILPYKGRLVALNTQEGAFNSSSATAFPNRARWTRIGTPYSSNANPTAISNITAANPAVVTSAGHGLITGETVWIWGVNGNMGGKLNNKSYIATVIDANNFSIPVDTTGLTYGGAGFAQSNGTTVPFGTFPIDALAWRDDIPGKGGFIDADTSERIVSAGIVKDTLIVAFQRSTWRLRYTGNEILPFIWERLNTQFGAESTYSNIEFDDGVLFFSRYGWIGADTNNCGRIDLDIPDDSFAVEANDSSFTGLSRVQGIRDFYRQFAYWTYEPIAQSSPTQIYAYNYIDKSWAIFNPSSPIKVFGEFFSNSDVTWSSLSNAGTGITDPDSDRWQFFNSATDTWENFGAGQNTGFPFIIGGDVNGNIFQLFEFNEAPTTDNGTLFSFSIATKRMNPYIEQGHKAKLGYIDVYFTTNVGGEITIQHFVDDQNGPVTTQILELFPRAALPVSAVTSGAVTTITTTSQHNILNQSQVSLGGFYGPIGNILNNQVVIATVVSSTVFTVPLDTTNVAYTTGGYVYTTPFDPGTTTYKRVYLGAIAHMHQIVFTLSPTQLTDELKATAQFELQGIVAWWRKVGRIRG